MFWLAIFFLGLVAIIAAGLFNIKGDLRRNPGYPYQKRDALFTPAERSFLGVLDKAVGSQYRIMGKVRLADVLEVTVGDRGKQRRGTGERGNRQSAQNRINSKHFDFLLCDPQDFSAVVAIELDDRSHKSAKRRQRDHFVDEACAAAGLPLIHIPARRAYTHSDIQRLVVNRLQPQESGSDFVSSEEGPVINRVEPDERAHACRPAEPAPQMPACPKCGGTMVLRRVRRGERAGEKLWGCSVYPKCRGIIPFQSLSGASIETAVKRGA